MCLIEMNIYSCLLGRNCCYRELLPRLPTDGIFAVDGSARKGVQCRGESISWQWKDDRGHWRPYSLVDSRIIEVVHCCYVHCMSAVTVICTW